VGGVGIIGRDLSIINRGARLMVTSNHLRAELSRKSRQNRLR